MKRILIILVLGFCLAGVGIAARVAYVRWPRPLPVRTAAVARVAELKAMVCANGEIRATPRARMKESPQRAPLEAELKVNETDVTRIKLGQRVTLTVNALKDKALPGHVLEIGTAALKGRTEEGRDFKVVIGLDRLPAKLTVGMNCEADILIDRREKVFAIPIAALTPRRIKVDARGNAAAAATAVPAREKRKIGRDEDKEVLGVFVMDEDGRARFKDVKTGLMGDMNVEVLAGLSEGGAVITGPLNSMRRLQEGMKVRLEGED